jgi:hypothetical protein
MSDIYKNTIKRNPFYDDTYLVLYQGLEGKRSLVEFTDIELLEIRYMVDKLLKDTYGIST